MVISKIFFLILSKSKIFWVLCLEIVALRNWETVDIYFNFFLAYACFKVSVIALFLLKISKLRFPLMSLFFILYNWRVKTKKSPKRTCNWGVGWYKGMNRLKFWNGLFFKKKKKIPLWWYDGNAEPQSGATRNAWGDSFQRV